VVLDRELAALENRAADIERMRGDAKPRVTALEHVDRYAAMAAGLPNLPRPHRDEALKLLVVQVRPGPGRKPEFHVTARLDTALLSAWKQADGYPSSIEA
jgi:hypothetical protein